MTEPSSATRTELRVWTPEEQKDIDRTVRALSMASIIEWEDRIVALEKPGRLIDRPAGQPGTGS